MTKRFTDYAFASASIDAIARTSPVRLNDAFSILDFGADPTGVEDSWPALVLAIRAARSAWIIANEVGIGFTEGQVKSAGVVYAPRGKYWFSKTIELIPGLVNERGIGITLRGESAASTLFFGDVEDWLISTGMSSGMTGGFVIENLSVHNLNMTPYLSGCILNGGQESCNRSLILTGMVGLALQSGTMWGGGAYGCVFRGPGIPSIVIGSLGMSRSSDGGTTSACYFENWDVALNLGRSSVVRGSVQERNRVGTFLGGQFGAGTGNTNPHAFGDGGSTGILLGNVYRSNGISIKIQGSGGAIEGYHIDCAPATGINPTSGDNVQDGIRATWVGGTVGGTVTGGPIDGLAYNYGNLSPHQNSPCLFICADTDVAYADRGMFHPPSVFSGEAKNWMYLNSDKAGVWAYDELSWGTLLNCSITDTTLLYSGYGRDQSIRNDYPTWLIGDDIVPGTKPTHNGTRFNFPIMDSGDGTGNVGNVLTFLGDPVGPTPISGADLLYAAAAKFSGGYVDDGSGAMSGGVVTNSGEIYTITNVVTLTGATISNGAGGAGDILSFSPVDIGYYSQLASFGFVRVAIGINGAGGIPRDTFIIARIDATHYQINRSLNISSTTIYLVSDIRPGYRIDSNTLADALGRPPPVNAIFDEELSLSQWSLDTSLSGGPVAWGPLGNGGITITMGSGDQGVIVHLVDKLNDQQWTFDGPPVSLGVGIQFLLNTYFVNHAQTVASQTVYFAVDNPGNLYEISDSPTPAWVSDLPSGTVKILPVGDSLTLGLNTSYGSYRKHLYELLTAAGITVDFVGHLSNGDFPEPQHAGITGDVINGTWGLFADDDYIAVQDPDVAIILTGTNNVWHGDGDIPAALSTYSNMLNTIATKWPTLKTIVMSLPPISVGDATKEANINVFNAGLRNLVRYKGGNFFFIDINKGLNTSDTADGVHWTNAGNDQIAELVFPVAMTVLDAGTSNVGQVINAGDGDYRVHAKFDRNRGYLIAG